MNARQLQEWINSKIKEEKLNVPLLVVDGKGGSLTRASFIQIFVNKNAKAITNQELKEISLMLGDKDTKRIRAVAEVESSGAGWFNSGLPKILYERHYFYRYSKILKDVLGLGWIGAKSSGGYTEDVNKNGINDSWEKLSHAVCIDPDAALKSVSIGSFQVMGCWYKELGYDHPLDMLWDARNSEYAHYKMLVGFIIKVARIQPHFLRISGKAETNIPFVRAYNGVAYAKNDYHNKLARAYIRM